MLKELAKLRTQYNTVVEMLGAIQEDLRALRSSGSLRGTLEEVPDSIEPRELSTIEAKEELEEDLAGKETLKRYVSYL